MNENPQELRRTAAREFMHSLNQLEGMLQPEPSSPEDRVESSQTTPQIGAPTPPEATELDPLASAQTFDQVVADIDRYIEEIESEDL